MHHPRKQRVNLSRRNRILAGANIESVARRAVPRFVAEPLEKRILLSSTWTVTNLNDAGGGSLRQAILNADNAGGTNIISFANGVTGTIAPSSALPDLTADTTINGPGASLLTIDGGGFGSVLVNDSGVTSEIENLTITGGQGTNETGGGILNNGGSFTINNSTITGNAAVSGGGVYSIGTLNITNSTISRNSSQIAGGGIFNDGSLTASNSVISENTVVSINKGGFSAGGGVFTSNGPVSFTGTIIIVNSAQYGGGVSSLSDNLPLNQAPITLTNCTISGNSARIGGGVDCTSSLTLAGTTISGNSATLYGGGISSDTHFGAPSNALFTITNSTIRDNTANDGAGVFSDRSLTLTGSMITGNIASIGGGGGGIANGGTLIVTGTTLSGNSAGDGGAISSNGILAVAGSTISGNTAAQDGGGISCGGSSAVTNSSVSGNTAKYGGGVYNFGTCAFVNSTATDNTASGNLSRGGGLSNFAVLTITDSTIGGNSTTAQGIGGGGIFNAGTLTAVNSTISTNSAGGFSDGGGILSRNSAEKTLVTLTNCTISGNFTFSSGGGIEADFASAITITDCTISANTAQFGGGVEFSTNSTGALSGDIIAANIGGDIGIEITPFLSGSHDLIGDGSDFGLLTASLRGSVANPLNPLLSSLGNFGGPTQTMVLEQGSPAIGAGANFPVLDSANNDITAADQRGVPRPSSPGFDIGAFQSGPLLVNTLADSTDSIPGIFSLRDAISFADSDTQGPPQTIAFAASLTGSINLASPLLDVGFNITIDGPGAGVIAVNAGGHGSVFTVTGYGVLIENLTITGGNSSFGGGIYNDGGLTLANSTITGNIASTAGGGIYNMSGSLAVINCTISGNNALNSGGGISNHGGMVTIINSTIASNSVQGSNEGNGDGGGGGVYSYGGFNGLGALTITNSTISANISGGDGGGIANNFGQLTVVNSTITGNFGQKGAAVYGLGSLDFADNTISGNPATGFGAFVIGFGGNGQTTNCTLDGTILAGNFGTDLFVGFSAQLIGSNDLIGNGSDGGVLTSTLRGVTNPMLFPLGNFGGPTQTLALRPGSPAIGGGAAFVSPGVNTGTDQRGIPRPQGGEFDIGAYQIQRSAFVVNTISDAALQPIGAVSLRDAIASAVSIGGSNTITFISGLHGAINLIDALPDITSNITIGGPGAGQINVAASNAGGILTVDGGETLAFENLLTAGGGLTVDSGAQLQLAANAGTFTLSALTIQSGGTVDIANNRIAIDYGVGNTSPSPAIRTELSTGAIFSSTVRGNSQDAVGYADGSVDSGTPAQPGQVLVKYTINGDANLDGLVSFLDLVAVVQNFNKAGTDWAHGNFQFGASTNFNDLVTIIQNFNKAPNPASSSSAGQPALAAQPLFQSAAIQTPKKSASAASSNNYNTSNPAALAAILTDPDGNILESNPDAASILAD